MSFMPVAFGVFLVIFLAVSGLGLVAVRWRRSGPLDTLNQWGLGGRAFGSWVGWFLLGGDLYTAYTFVAVPGAMYAAGAVSGWFAIAYSVLVWPVVFVLMPRLWSVCRSKGYETPADFVVGRFGGSGLGLAVAFTGILAIMPYVAVQLVGIESVLQVMGLGNSGSAVVRDIPLAIAFAVMAVSTYQGGLRAPALVAFAKDALIYLTVIVAIVYIPVRLGGYGHIFSVVAAHAKASAAAAAAAAAHGSAKTAVFSYLPGPKSYWAYATLALGSTLALFMYPHAVNGVLSTNSREVIRRNIVALPLYSLALAFIALLGYMAIAAGIKTANSRLAAPLLFRHMFPGWFAGIAYAAVVVGALVPAAIMSIAAANLFTKNIYKAYLRRRAGHQEQVQVSKLGALVVKFCALVFAFAVSTQSALNLQLLGGIWVLQTFPALALGLFTKWFHKWALTVGWAVGMGYGTYAAYVQHSALTSHFASSLVKIPGLGQSVYIALVALVLNLVVGAGATVLLRVVAPATAGPDETEPADYLAGSLPIDAVPALAGTPDGLAGVPANLATE